MLLKYVVTFNILLVFNKNSTSIYFLKGLILAAAILFIILVIPMLLKFCTNHNNQIINHPNNQDSNNFDNNTYLGMSFPPQYNSLEIVIGKSQSIPSLPDYISLFEKS